MGEILLQGLEGSQMKGFRVLCDFVNLSGRGQGLRHNSRRVALGVGDLDGHLAQKDAEGICDLFGPVFLGIVADFF